MHMNLDDTFLEIWSREVQDTDIQYRKAISLIKPLISCDNAISNDVADPKCEYDVDTCVAAFHKTKELTANKQKLQQEQARLSREIESLNKKNKALEEALKSCEEKCLQISSQNKYQKKLLKTAINKYEKNLDLVITTEDKSETTYEATFMIKSKKKKVLKVLIDRAKAEILDCTILLELSNDINTSDIPNILYLLRKHLIKQ